MCKRVVEGKSQSIIVAMETLTEKNCRKLGLSKSRQYTSAGWACFGLKGEEFFSCENKPASSFAFYNGNKLDYLTFTNRLKHRSILAYLNPGSNKLCHEDRDELKSAGIKDAVCHRP